MKARRIVFAVLLAATTAAWAADGYISDRPSAVAGAVRVSCAAPGSWRFSERIDRETNGVETLTVSLRSDGAAVPPRFDVAFSVPQREIHYAWTPSVSDGYTLKPDWSWHGRSSLANWLPLYAYLDNGGETKLTVACSESIRKVGFRSGLREEDCTVPVRFEFFVEPEAPITAYEVSVRMDPRRRFYGKSLDEAVAWMERSVRGRPCDSPPEAFEPLYSTWYGFHQDVFAGDIEEECARASKLGMKVLIVDDGWQTDDTNRGYAFCGDWEPSKRRFPDMAAHVRRVQAMGMKYMLWYAVPFVGDRSAVYGRFKDKCLRHVDGLGASVLDPRFPEVREHIVGTYERAVREWGLDGFKLDFIDDFAPGSVDPAVRENYRGRDVKSVSEATDILMTEISRRLRKLRPDILIEFRQSYVGPAIRKYGNMLRAGDCPGDARSNRIRTAALRLTSRRTAVHSDMLEWHPDTTPEEAALTILNALFSTVQYSMQLRKLPDSHLRMLRHWIGFTTAHREALLGGEFRPLHPEAWYPILVGESARERVVAVYGRSCVAEVAGDRKTIVVNATERKGVFMKLDRAPVRARIYDVFGEAVGTPALAEGPQEVSVPAAGYLEMEF